MVKVDLSPSKQSFPRTAPGSFFLKSGQKMHSIETEEWKSNKPMYLLLGMAGQKPTPMELRGSSKTVTKCAESVENA